MIDKNASTAKRLIVARVLLIIVAILAAYVASTRPDDIVAMVAWAFSLAAAGLFPALVLGIWSKRVNKYGAVFGILAGFFMTLIYLMVTRYYPWIGVEYLGMYSNVNAVTGANLVDVVKLKADNAALYYQNLVGVSHPMANRVGWFNVSNISAGLFGLPVGFIVMYVVSLLTPAPSKELIAFIDAVRRPRGKSLMEEKTT
jgi:cation/acetate symporter